MTQLIHLSTACVLLGLMGSACDKKTSPASARAEELYVSHCARCHEVGAANAPKRGDEQTWAKRLRKGEATLVASIKKGTVAMPPRGECDECTDDDFRALVKYLAH